MPPVTVEITHGCDVTNALTPVSSSYISTQTHSIFAVCSVPVYICFSPSCFTSQQGTRFKGHGRIRRDAHLHPRSLNSNAAGPIVALHTDRPRLARVDRLWFEVVCVCMRNSEWVIISEVAWATQTGARTSKGVEVPVRQRRPLCCWGTPFAGLECAS